MLQVRERRKGFLQFKDRQCKQGFANKLANKKRGFWRDCNVCSVNVTRFRGPEWRFCLPGHNPLLEATRGVWVYCVRQ